MDDIKPRSTNRAVKLPRPVAGSGKQAGAGNTPKVVNAPIEASDDMPHMWADDEPTSFSPALKPKKSSKIRWALAIVGIFILLLIGGGVAAKVWYDQALEPVSQQEERIRVRVESGQAVDAIARTLKEEGVIKSQLAFRILAKQTGTLHTLQAGEYFLSPSQSAQEILDVLAEGKIDTYNVTILPGLTLKTLKQKLQKDGFAADKIDAAFAKEYDHPLLADKPADMSLEGYIFPDTYQVNSQTTVEQLLMRSFDTLYAKVQAEGIVAGLKDRGFTLHQGITLASIVQKEVSDYDTQRQVAQVFEHRLSIDMELGSDVTFMYAAELTGQEERVDIDSPYNTRRYKGLPPGPIANFNFHALQAVANPASGDFVYFVAGDDGKTHFAHTLDEHEHNVQLYCIKLCQ